MVGFYFFLKNHLEASAHLLVVLAFFICRRTMFTQRYGKFLFLYHVSSLLFLGIADILAFSMTPNLLWYNLNGFFSIVILSFFFRVVSFNFRIRDIISGIGICTAVIYTTACLFVDDRTALFSPGFFMVCTLVVLFCILYFWDKLMTYQYAGQNVFNSISTWFVIALTLYYSCGFTILVSYRYITLNQNLEAIKKYPIGFFWGVHNVILFLSCLMEITAVTYFHRRSMKCNHKNGK